MKQMSLASGFELVTKRTRKRVFLDGMDKAITWSDLLALIAPHARKGRTGRSPFAKEVMLRIHFLHGKSAANSALFSQYEHSRLNLRKSGVVQIAPKEQP
jgi:hypothetical protein